MNNIAMIYIGSLLICLLIALYKAFVNSYEELILLIPIVIAGGLYLGLLLNSLNRKENLFSVGVIYSSFGVVFYYLAPLSQIVWDFWPSLPKEGLREWVSVWSLIGVFGFFIVETLRIRAVQYRHRTLLLLDKVYFEKAFLIISAICIVAQVLILAKFGGISGIVGAYELRLSEGIQNYNPYAGFGFAFTIAESFPNIVAIYIIYRFKDDHRFHLTRYLIFYLVFLFLINMIFGGVRGSRSTTVWSMFWALALYNMMVRNVSLKFMLVGVFAFGVFMSMYSLYKFGGVDGLKGIYDSNVKAEIYAERNIDDAEKLVLVRDASRADVQAFILRGVVNGDIEYSYGRSIVAGIVSFIPSFIWSDKPDTFVKEKTEIFIGEWFYSKETYTTLLTGMYGEFLVNFGLPGVLLYFIALGLLLKWLQSYSDGLDANDARRYFLPIFLLCIIQFMMSDSNVISQFLFRYLALPFILILSAVRYKKAL